jgi:hypothetical protein
MKATLEFELPEEHETFLDAVHAHDYKDLVAGVLSAIRESHRYDSGPFAKCDPDSLETIREWLNIELMDRGVSV